MSGTREALAVADRPGEETVASARPAGRAPGPRPFRVLFLHFGGDWLRGSETSLLGILDGLDRERFSPMLACNQAILAEGARKLGVEAILIDRPRVMVEGGALHLELLRWARTLVRLRRLVARRRVDLLYCSNAQPAQLGHYVGRLTGASCVAHLQAFYNRRYIYGYRLNRLPSLIFCSEAVRSFHGRLAKLPPRSYVIHNAVDTARFHPRPKAPGRDGARSAGDGKVVIGQVGSLIDRKGVDVLLRAFARLVEERLPVRLALVGGGPREPEYRRLAAELGIERQVAFHGEAAAPERFYREVLDINVLASREEAFGITLIEAGASGLPSVAARTGGIPEVIAEGETGYLFDGAAPESLADRLRVLVRDESLRSEMGTRARRRVIEKFSVETQVRAVEAALGDLLEERRRRGG